MVQFSSFFYSYFFPNILKNFIHELFMACIFARLKSPTTRRKHTAKISYNNKRNGSIVQNKKGRKDKKK